MERFKKFTKKYERLCNWLVWLLAVALPGGLVVTTILFILTGSTRLRPPIWPRTFNFKPILSYF